MLRNSLLVFIQAVCLTASAQSFFQNEYLAVWDRASAYTLEVAEAMPEEYYNFKPGGEGMSFQEQMVHITQNIAFLAQKINGEIPVWGGVNQGKLLDKEEVIENLKTSLAYVTQLIKDSEAITLHERITFGGDDVTKEHIFYLMRDHMAHHRGQAILHLRMNNIDAPAYRGW